MTECTGKRYWQGRIKECIDRERQRFGQRLAIYQFTMPTDVRKRLAEWHEQRIIYLRKTGARWGKGAA